MTGRKPGSKRRTVLRNLASIATGSALFAGTVGATSKRQQKAEATEFGKRVPFGQAKKVATAARQRYAQRAYSSWKGATVGKPRKFFTKIKLNTRKKYVPTAYVFPVRSSHSPVGYLTISARKKWSPVLEASTADPPGLDEHSVKNMVRQQGERPTGTYLYRGATTYSVELESGKQLYLNTGLKEGTTTETPQLEVEKHGESVESQWSTADTIPTGDVQIQGSYGIVNGIEPWDANGGSGSLSGSDEGGADTSVPDLYGNTPDKWAECDGCAPFAG